MAVWSPITPALRINAVSIGRAPRSEHVFLPLHLPDHDDVARLGSHGGLGLGRLDSPRKAMALLSDVHLSGCDADMCGVLCRWLL